MGKASHSRKGKKAWRKNIDVQDVEELIAEKAVEGLHPPKPDTLPDDALFFVDKDADDTLVPKSVAARRSRSAAAAARPLRSELVLQAALAAARPVHSSAPKRPVGALRPPRNSAAAAAAEEAALAAALSGSKKLRRARMLQRKAEASSIDDLWGGGGAGGAADNDWTTNVPAEQLARIGRKQQQQQQEQQQRKKLPGRRPAPKLPAAVPAVEVDAPGCAYNPEPEAHQDALAAVAAAEVKRALAAKLGPKPPPARVAAANGSALDPVAAALGIGTGDVAALVGAEGDSDGGDDDGDEAAALDQRQQQQQQQKGARAGGKRKAGGEPNAIDVASSGSGEEGEEEEDGSDDDAGAAEEESEDESEQQQQQQAAADSDDDGAAAAAAKRHAAAAAAGKKTRTDRNRDARRRAQEAEAAARAALKRQRADLAALGDVEAKLAEEEAERAARRLRRTTVAAERAATLPPRLGKHKFVPAPAPVLPSDEIDGSLRRLAAYPLVAADRFAALQKRGLIEVLKPSGGSARGGRRVAYMPGARAERAAAAQADIDGAKRARIKAARKAKAAKAAGGGGGAGGLRMVPDAELHAATLGW